MDSRNDIVVYIVDQNISIQKIAERFGKNWYDIKDIINAKRVTNQYSPCLAWSEGILKQLYEFTIVWKDKKVKRNTIQQYFDVPTIS